MCGYVVWLFVHLPTLDKSGNTVLTSAPPDGICSKEPPAAADITQQVVPLANGEKTNKHTINE